MTSLRMLYVSAIESISPLGGTADMANRMIAAGVSAYGEVGFHNARNCPIIGAGVPAEALPELKRELQWRVMSGREKRLLKLASVVSKKIVAQLDSELPVPLFLAGPEPIPGTLGASAKLLRYLVEQSEIAVDLSKSRYFASGRSGMLEAVDLAFSYLEISEEDSVLVGGVDSYLDPMIIGALDAEQRLLSELNSDGFAPSEGASFLVLSRTPTAIAGQSFVISRPGLGVEPGHRYSDEPYQGVGLDQACKKAIHLAGAASIDAVYSTMNGEHHFAKEYGIATMRSASVMKDGFTHFHPSDCYGDVGAASGGMLIGYAMHNMRCNAHVNPVLIYGSSDQATRAALCLAKVA